MLSIQEDTSRAPRVEMASLSYKFESVLTTSVTSDALWRTNRLPVALMAQLNSSYTNPRFVLLKNSTFLLDGPMAGSTD